MVVFQILSGLASGLQLTTLHPLPLLYIQSWSILSVMDTLFWMWLAGRLTSDHAHAYANYVMGVLAAAWLAESKEPYKICQAYLLVMVDMKRSRAR